MKLAALIALFGVALLATSTVYLVSKSASNDQLVSLQHIDYVFYQIEIEWPGSVCKFNNCNKRDLENFDGKHFNLHGVWPTGTSANACTYVNDCQNLPFDNSLIAPEIMVGLDQYWTGVYNPSEPFRQHEWEKHGVCWNDSFYNGPTEDENLATYMNNYFSLALGVIKNYEPFNVLVPNGIVPSDSQGYDYSQVFTLLKPQFGEGVIGKCKTVSGVQYLHSVDFCLGKDYQPIDCPCPSAKKTNCKTNLPVYIGEFVMPSN